MFLEYLLSYFLSRLVKKVSENLVCVAHALIEENLLETDQIRLINYHLFTQNNSVENQIRS